MRAFITGGTGFIGQRLAAALLDRGDEVVVLSRDPRRAPAPLAQRATLIEGDPTQSGAWQKSMAGCDAVISLAGASIAGRRWNARFKQVLLNSRVDSSIKLVEGIAALDKADRPGTLVSASGVDIYPFEVDLPPEEGIPDDPWIDESAPVGDTFLARMCRDWEREARAARDHGVRVVTMRTGLVLARGGGALEALERVFKLFVGGRLGPGRQWMSWIHILDVVGAYLHAIDGDLEGPTNVVAPNPVRNREFARSLGKALGRPSILPTPGFALRLVAGELAEYLLSGRRVKPARLADSGYEFAFVRLEDALHDLYS